MLCKSQNRHAAEAQRGSGVPGVPVPSGIVSSAPGVYSMGPGCCTRISVRLNRDPCLAERNQTESVSRSRSCHSGTFVRVAVSVSRSGEQALILGGNLLALLRVRSRGRNHDRLAPEHEFLDRLLDVGKGPVISLLGRGVLCLLYTSPSPRD